MSPAAAARVAAVPVAVGAVLGAVLGAVGGFVWWTWWGPAPAGKIYDTTRGPKWYPDPFDPGITRDFSGTATYVVVGFVIALLLGLAAGWVCRHTALVGLGAVAVASIVGAAVMVVVGVAQSPANPQDQASAATIGKAFPGHLEVVGFTPYLAWPVGALLGYLVVMLSITAESRRPEQPSAAPALQD